MNYCATAQTENPANYDEVNTPVHDYFLTNLKYYRVKEAQVKSLLKKPLILDFFSTGCTACFMSFPKLNALQKEFGDSVQFMLVGKEDGKLQNIYEHYRITKKLNLPVAFDSSTFSKAVPNAVPYILWIGTDGVVKAITSSGDLNGSNVRDFIQGQRFSFFDRSNSTITRQRQLYDSLDNNAKPSIKDSSMVIQSFLQRLPGFLSPFIPTSIDEQVQYISNRKFQLYSGSIINLYQYAYAGVTMLRPEDSLYSQISLIPVLETRDSLRLMNSFHGRGEAFAYSTIIPQVNNPAQVFRERIKTDLQQAFGYDVSIQRRPVKCLKLIALPNAVQNLRNDRFDSSHADFSFYHVALNDVPMSDVSNALIEFLNSPGLILDETGIKFTVDIELNITFNNKEKIIKELNRNGLDLVAGIADMNVIVIKDPIEQ